MNRWASAWPDPRYRFASDEDVAFGSAHAIDPRVSHWDLSNDTLGWCDTRLKLANDLLQPALVHVNTLLMQQVLADPKWADRLTDADRRGPSPLFWTHVNPYGRFELDMNSRLDLGPAAAIPGQRTEEPQPAATG